MTTNVESALGLYKSSFSESPQSPSRQRQGLRILSDKKRAMLACPAILLRCYTSVTMNFVR